MTIKIKTFLIIIFCFSVCFRSLSQVKYGFRFGGNISKMKMHDEEGEISETVKPGLNFALLFNFPLQKSFSIQIEPGFSQLGTKYETILKNSINNSTSQLVDIGKVHLSYVELPVIMQYNHQLGNVRIFGSLGPQVRVLAKPLTVDYTVSYFEDGILAGQEKTYEGRGGKSGIRKLDYGLAIGVGVEVRLRLLRFFSEVHYNQGIRKVDAPYYNGSKAINIYTSINLGLLLPLK